MLVMGGIIGSGIFVTPAEVARHVDTPLAHRRRVAPRRPRRARRRLRLRRACRPPSRGRRPICLSSRRLRTDAGLPLRLGAAARDPDRRDGRGRDHLRALFRRSGAAVRCPTARSPSAVLALLTLINCLGVRSGSNVQSGLMVLKIVAIATLVLAGLAVRSGDRVAAASRLRTASISTLAAIGAAMTPVMFSYGGWQTASFVAGEMRDPRRDLARGLLFGVVGVVILYPSVAFVCVHALGPAGLAALEDAGDRRHAPRARRHAARPSSRSASRSRRSASSARACSPRRASISPWPRTASSSAASPR